MKHFKSEEEKWAYHLLNGAGIVIREKINTSIHTSFLLPILKINFVRFD